MIHLFHPKHNIKVAFPHELHYFNIYKEEIEQNNTK